MVAASSISRLQRRQPRWAVHPRRPGRRPDDAAMGADGLHGSLHSRLGHLGPPRRLLGRRRLLHSALHQSPVRGRCRLYRGALTMVPDTLTESITTESSVVGWLPHVNAGSAIGRSLSLPAAVSRSRLPCLRTTTGAPTPPGRPRALRSDHEPCAQTTASCERSSVTVRGYGRIISLSSWSRM